MSVQEERIQQLNENKTLSGDYVLYWMQASQRAELNHALEYSILKANKLGQRLAVVFCVAEYPEATSSHYKFMLEGLLDVESALKRRKARFIVRIGEPEEIVPDLANSASLVVVDRDYQKLQRQWRSEIAASVRCPVTQIESNVVVPIETVTEKEQYSAGTIRPRIHRHLDRFLEEMNPNRLEKDSRRLDLDGTDISEPSKVLSKLQIENKTDQTVRFRGGTSEAKKLFQVFLRDKIDGYDELRNDPSLDYLSNMSPYLHFGQVSPLFLALSATESGSPGAESYIEELVVRRELAINFVFYNNDYDSIASLPNWARTTLDEHRDDPREYTYSLSDLESVKTHDPYWNAAQLEMNHTGKMHGYMRMYWGKKILEWSETPDKGYEYTLHLNNKYELDGRDPNGYAGVSWCFGKHDRAWKERPIFGKVRYMNDRGLERKFDIQSYVDSIENKVSGL
jgi:deoxyribodipyrimidine photo-lyase